MIEFIELDTNVSDKKIQSEMAKSGQKVLKGLQKAVMLNIIVSTKNYASFIRNVIYQDNSLKKIWKEKNLPTSSLTPTGQEYDFTKQFEFKGLDFSNLKSSLANLNTSGYR